MYQNQPKTLKDIEIGKFIVNLMSRQDLREIWIFLIPSLKDSLLTPVATW